jgi:hypothetical protein
MVYSCIEVYIAVILSTAEFGYRKYVLNPILKANGQNVNLKKKIRLLKTILI